MSAEPKPNRELFPSVSLASDAGPDDRAGRLQSPPADATDCYGPLQTLKPKQRLAIDCLAIGLGDEETAERVGTHRVTITRWRLYDDAFRNAYADRLSEIWANAADHLRALVPRALSTIHWALECGEEKTRVRAAIELLKIVGRASR